MPSPAITLKLKRFRQRFGIAAPRVSVRTHFAWYWYLVAAAILAFMVAFGAWWLAQRDEVVLMKSELARLRQSLDEAEAELSQLRSLAGTEQSALRMERSTQQQLAARLKALEEENSTLREDVALFEKLVPATSVEPVLRIERLNIVSEAQAGHFRYRLLLAFQPSKQERVFRGRLQLTVTAQQGDKEISLHLPSAKDAAADFMVEAQHFLRKEGRIALPTGARIKSIEAQILQGGAIKAKQRVNY